MYNDNLNQCVVMSSCMKKFGMINGKLPINLIKFEKLTIVEKGVWGKKQTKTLLKQIHAHFLLQIKLQDLHSKVI